MEPIDRLLPLVKRPSTYIDHEVNRHSKDPKGSEVLFALCFPEVYEVGMSYPGLCLLYWLLNSMEGVVCERVFAPFPDMEAILRRERIPLGSLESRIPLKEFDIVGFSLQYELTYTNLLNILDLGGIPLRSADRDRDMPLVIAGGPGAMNPEPLAEFVDAFVLGDGEEVLREIVDLFRLWKKARGTKDELLEALAGIPGVYVPSFFEVRTGGDGKIKEIRPIKGDYKEVRRRVVPDLDLYRLPPKPLVPLAKVIHDRLSLEVARGCIRGCRFCQAGFIYRPFRERDPKGLISTVEEALKGTGYDEISLLALSIGDCSFLEPLLSFLAERYSPDKVALSLPSLRIGTLREEVVKLLRKVRKTGITLAPEVATPRLQGVINKVISEEEALQTASVAFKYGWRHIKLYFMVGLPTETLEDVRAIASLARKVSREGGQVNVSVSTFVPKAHTPFQWERMIGPEEIIERHCTVRAELRGKGIRFKGHSPQMSFLEGVFSRGDRRLGRVLLEAFRLGCRLDGWSEYLRWEKWQEAFHRAGVDPSFYLRERSEGEILPWNHLKSGVEERYLLQERQKAYLGEVSDPCKPGCRRCGCCKEGIEIKVKAASLPLPPTKDKGRARGQGGGVIRVRFYKIGPMRFLSHLEMVETFFRALRRAEVPLRFSEGFHPLPRVTFSHALPVGVESVVEYFDAELSEPFPAEELRRRLNLHLPQGLGILEARNLIEKTKSLPALLQEDVYLCRWEGRPFEIPQGPVLLKVGKGDEAKEVDLSHYLVKAEVIETTAFRIPVPEELLNLKETFGERALLIRLKRGLRPHYALGYLLEIPQEEVSKLRILKVGTSPRLF